MENTWFIADCHLSHAGIIKHCDRPYLKPNDLDENGRWVSEEIKQARTDEMDADILGTWNNVVSRKDVVYIVGDHAWKNHRRWLNELNGKKILIIGSHDKIPQDCLDLFKPDWTCEDMSRIEAMKTLFQFREVHHSLVRKICGQDMHLYHWPGMTWQGKPHGSWMVTGHCHGRMKVARPKEYGAGLILDVGWDVFKRPISFYELREEMRIKKEMMGDRFYGKDEIIN